MKRRQRNNTPKAVTTGGYRKQASGAPKMAEAVRQAKAEGAPIYRVLRAFKYDEEFMAVGGAWVPRGFPKDGSVIASGRLVAVVDRNLPVYKRARSALVMGG